MPPSEFWGLSLAEFIAIYEINREKSRVGNVSQGQIDDMLSVQELLDAGVDPVEAMRLATGTR